MCMYAVEREDGIANELSISLTMVHVLSEALDSLLLKQLAEPDGRITNKDLGLWNEEQKKSYISSQRGA